MISITIIITARFVIIIINIIMLVIGTITIFIILFLLLRYVTLRYVTLRYAMYCTGEDPFGEYYNFDDEDIDEYLKLGPLELKLLSVTGETKPIYIQGSSIEDIKGHAYNPKNWPVTQPMMKAVTASAVAEELTA